jgi:hypothetical protein
MSKKGKKPQAPIKKNTASDLEKEKLHEEEPDERRRPREEDAEESE